MASSSKVAPPLQNVYVQAAAHGGADHVTCARTLAVPERDQLVTRFAVLGHLLVADDPRAPPVLLPQGAHDCDLEVVLFREALGQLVRSRRPARDQLDLDA